MRYAGRYAKELLRVVIRENLNRHEKGSLPDIALIGSRRSGSTLLMQMIGATRGVKFSNQPLSPGSGPPHQAMRLVRFYRDYFLCADEQILSEVRRYIGDISSGELKLDEPWRFWRPDFHFRSDRVVLKLTNAGHLRDLLSDLGLQGVDFLRHPLHQAMSCERNRWADGVRAFLSCNAFVEDRLDERQREVAFQIGGSDDYFQKLLLTWVFENIPVLRDTTETRPLIYYEDLIEDTGAIFRRLCDHLTLDFDRGIHAIQRPSYSATRHSDPATRKSIASGSLLSSAMRRHEGIDEERKRKLQGLLDLFEIGAYAAPDFRPRAASFVPQVNIR